MAAPNNLFQISIAHLIRCHIVNAIPSAVMGTKQHLRDGYTSGCLEQRAPLLTPRCSNVVCLIEIQHSALAFYSGAVSRSRSRSVSRHEYGNVTRPRQKAICFRNESSPVLILKGVFCAFAMQVGLCSTCTTGRMN